MDTTVQTCLQLLFLVVFVLHSSSSQAVTNSTAPLYCYQCNSGKGFDGPTCDPDVKQSLSEDFKKACPNDPGRVYTRCRKLVQDVEGEHRVIRTCATAGVFGVKADRCIDRAGTVRIKVKYCDCTNDKPDHPCNSSPRRDVIVTSLLAMSVVISSVIGALMVI